MQQWPTVLLFGAPGSGKGTQAKFLCSLLPFVHISTGDLFRSIPKDSLLSQQLLSYSSKGALAPDGLTLQIWQQYVQGLVQTFRFNPNSQLLLLDGLPRTREQAQMLDAHIEVQMIIELKITNEPALISRLLKRSQLEGRIDDARVDVIEKRLQIYNDQTCQALSHYNASRIVTIDADLAPLAVLQNILPHMDRLVQRLK